MPGPPETAPGVSTFDLTPATEPAGPYRPGQGDLNGLGLIDDADFPPDWQTMPTAAFLVTMGWLALALGKVVPSATVSVTFGGGAPIVNQQATLTNNKVTFTIGRTAGGAGAGDVTFTWPASTFPTPAARPKASVNGIVPGMIAADWVPNGVRIVTLNAAGAATDLPFTVDLP